MKSSFLMLGLSTVLLLVGTAQAQVDLSTLDAHMVGPRAQVLVLGTAHLSQMPKSFKPESMEPVMARLVAFKPDVITIEAISGEGCDLMTRYPTVYAPTDVTIYCNDTVDAKAATGLDVPAAIGEIGKTLATWPTNPSAAQRRHLAALFLAANDGPSALTQWLQLAPTERHVGDGLNDALVARLHKVEASHNEDYLVAAHLAARSGLQRVFSVDDHTGDNLVITDEAAYEKAIRQAWDSDHANVAPIRARQDELSKGGDMLALYRYLNRPDVLRIAIDGDFGAAMRDPSPQQFGRQYVGGWETRNLRMVANVLSTLRDRPDARVLAIVGSSHKPWFDSLLGQMQGVDIVDAEEALQAP